MFRSVRKAALTLCCTLGLAQIPFVYLYAAEVGLDAEIGFHGVFHLGDPFPVTVELTNAGRPVEGTLEVKVWKGGAIKGTDAYPFYYRREIVLSAQSHKSVQLTIDPDSLSRPLTVSFSSPTVSVSKEINLRRYFAPSPLILVLAEEGASLSIPVLSGSSNPVVFLSLEQLPVDARAYRGVWALILYEESLRDLSRFQTLALDGWISSGGRLIILGSIHYALYQEASMSRFLPVRVTGLKKVSSLSSLESVYKKKSSALKDLLVQDSKLVQGRVVIEEQGTPILVEQEKGRGKLTYLSLDVGRPPLSQWGGLPLLFQDLLGSPTERNLASETRWDESVFSQILVNPFFISSYIPVRSFLAWTTFYFGALGFLAWLWLKQRFSRRTLLAAFCSLLVFSSTAGALHFERGGNVPGGVILTSTLLESAPDGYADAESNVALFSTQNRQYNLRIERGWSDLQPVPRFGGPQEVAMTVQGEGGSSRFQFPLREWDFRLFKVRSISYFPLRIEMKSEGNHLSLRLTNATPNDLTECWLVAAGQKFFLGDIPRGSSQLRDFSLAYDNPQGGGEYKNQNTGALREIGFSDKMRDLLFRYSFFPQDQGGAPWVGGSAVIFGWVKNSPRRVWLEDSSALAHDYTLFRAVLPLGEEDDS